MAGFFSDNPPPTQVGTEDAAESTIQEDAVTQGDTSSGFFQGSPEQTSTNDYTTHVGTIYTVGDGGLTQKNFTAEQSSKLSGVATSANNYILPFTDNSTNWDTAYGWGSHATAGYLTSVDASSINSASVTDGYVLTADGAGNAAWEASTGGSSGSGNAESLEFVDILGALGAGVSPDWNRNTFNTTRRERWAKTSDTENAKKHERWAKDRDATSAKRRASKPSSSALWSKSLSCWPKVAVRVGVGQFTVKVTKMSRSVRPRDTGTRSTTFGSRSL